MASTASFGARAIFPRAIASGLGYSSPMNETLPPRKRLAAILAADVVGYSRAMAADEDGTFRAVAALFDGTLAPVVARRGGRIFKRMGDGLLAEFPSVGDAVTAAVEIQAALAARPGPGLMIRIGVNLGDVIAHQGDLYGDGVNVAARVEALAPAGGVCITRPVRDQIRDRLPYALIDLGEIAVKNIRRPVRVFRVETEARSAAPPSRSQRAAVGAALRTGLTAAVLAAADAGLAPVPEPVDPPLALPIEAVEISRWTRTETALAAGPGPGFPATARIPAGTRLEATGRIEVSGRGYLRVRIEGETRYLPEATVTETPPPAPLYPPVPPPPAAPPRETPRRETPLAPLPVAPAATPATATPSAGAAPEPDLPGPSGRPDSIRVRISLDLDSNWNQCALARDNAVHRLPLDPDSRWRRIRNLGGADMELRARARRDGDAIVVSIWPYARTWSAADALSIRFDDPRPGAQGRAFSGQWAPPPYAVCGRLAAYVAILE
ncbi:MAG: adenylate/guanylate cyclase domain-containing protein [Paracoccaceae bacterium]